METCPHEYATAYGQAWHRRAGFAKRSLWVTPYYNEQMFAAGFYVNQSYSGAGWDEWTKEKKNVEDEDVVIWHTFSVTHIPRVEDFLVMPADRIQSTIRIVTCLSFSLDLYMWLHTETLTQNPGLDILLRVDASDSPMAMRTKAIELFQFSNSIVYIWEINTPVDETEVNLGVLFGFGQVELMLNMCIITWLGQIGHLVHIYHEILLRHSG
ncbi:copper amine oxidase [Jimgerdemannia flammicorona]|uniref:Amine oxidase n=1 Tax=Jimgerdemannia flammicorona TaxID=994334 RepID=A0A433QNR0_9FUNG|nr:copper amine oxidase [Jimgerdemannia flammicorona]